MKSSLLRTEFDTAWKYQVERPISGKTRLRMMAACIGDINTEVNESLIDSRLLTISVLFFAIGFITSL